MSSKPARRGKRWRDRQSKKHAGTAAGTPSSSPSPSPVSLSGAAVRRECISQGRQIVNADHIVLYRANLRRMDDCDYTMSYLQQWGIKHPEVVLALGAHCPRLTKADFTGMNLTDRSLQILCRHLPVSVTYLDLTANMIKFIPVELRRLNSLQQLQCRNNHWSSKNMPPYTNADSDDVMKLRATAKWALKYACSLPAPDDWDDETEIMVKPASHEAWIEDDERHEPRSQAVGGEVWSASAWQSASESAW